MIENHHQFTEHTGSTSPQQKDEDKNLRIIESLSHSTVAMLVTSATTGAAFFATSVGGTSF